MAETDVPVNNLLEKCAVCGGGRLLFYRHWDELICLRTCWKVAVLLGFGWKDLLFSKVEVRRY